MNICSVVSRDIEIWRDFHVPHQSGGHLSHSRWWSGGRHGKNLSRQDQYDTLWHDWHSCQSFGVVRIPYRVASREQWLAGVFVNF